MMNKGVFLLAAVTLFIFFSCTDESDPLAIGDKFISSQTHVSLVDNYSLKLSSIVIDSFPSNNPANIMVGRYVDEYLGKVSSTAYFQLGVPEFDEVDDNVVFDSLMLVLTYNGMAYGDTAKQQTIFVHEVLEEIEETDDYYIYNTSSFKYSDQPLGSKTFTPRPNRDDTLCIRLSDELGMEFLQMMKDGNDDIKSSEEFIDDFFKGMALVPGSENATVLGFECADSLVEVKLYTHLVSQSPVEQMYSFKIYSTELCFNNVKTDRSGTVAEDLKIQKEELASALSGDKSFIQGGAGIMARVDFTELNQIMEMDYRYILYKAELVLRPYSPSYSQIEFPEQLILYTTDKYNRLVSSIQDDNEEDVVADFYLDKIYRKDSYYKFDITEFIQDELSDGYFDPDNGLIISVPGNKMKSSVERLVIDGRTQDSFRPTLNLYFIFYN